MNRHAMPLFSTFMIACLCLIGVGPAPATQVAVDTATEYQTIIGWGATTPWLLDVPDDLALRIVDVGVNDLGLTRLRFEGAAGNMADVHRWEWDNDDDDPLHINWSAYNTADFDTKTLKYVVPTKQAVEAAGRPFNIYVSPSFFDNGSSGAAPPWLLRNPGEYSEFAMACLLRLRHHGVEADHYVILNEAGNDNQFYPTVVARMIKALGPRMAAAGLPTGIQFPESINAYAGWTAIQQTAGDEMMWRYVNMLSYHLYGGTDYRDDYRDFGLARGLPTAQTEYMSMTINTLYDDMTQAYTSVWEVYGQGFPLPDLARTGYTRKTYFWDFRQAMHYVAPGAVRVEATSDDSTVRSLAFVDGGEVTVLLINNAASAKDVTLTGLPAGDYAASQTVSQNVPTERGVQTVDAGGTLTINLPRYGILTLYPHNGNRAPEIHLAESVPAYLKPADSGMAQLSVQATDPELDALTYQWTVLSAPEGADFVTLATPTAASSFVFGMSLPGEYAFGVTVSDGQTADTSEVRIKYFAENQPPRVGVHNRKPVLLTLPVNYTLLRGEAQDLEGDAMTYLWTIVSQPAGANAQLVSPTTGACDAISMDVPGDYVFRFTATDAYGSNAADLTVPVYPVNNNAPYITGPSASVLPSGRGLLTATTGENDGDAYSRWWELVSLPAGANASFTSQSSDATVVSVDTAGAYGFRLIVTDRTKYSQSSTLTLNLTPTVPLAGGDANEDGAVDIQDFVTLKQNYGAAGKTWSNGDFNGDKKVDIQDFVILKQNYGL